MQASPCKSTDGVLYAGSKLDNWLAIDPHTGRKVETLNGDQSNRVCPANKPETIFIGRTLYTVTMYDSKSLLKRWNCTYYDYSSHLLPEDSTYSFKHFTSTSDGRLVTVDGENGSILFFNQI